MAGSVALAPNGTPVANTASCIARRPETRRRRLSFSQQPAPFSAGQTATVRNSFGEVEEENRKAVGVPATTSVEEVVKAINALGASPRDLVAILQALKAVGSLDADIEVL